MHEALRELAHDPYINTDSLLLVSLLHNSAILCAKTRRSELTRCYGSCHERQTSH